MELALALVAGVVAGVINTLAGSGSFLTLPALILLGLPPHVANGTNRLGILIAGLVSVGTFRAEGALETRGLSGLVVPSILGAIVGAWIAVDLDPEVMHTAIGVIMLVMLGMLLFRPARWLARDEDPTARRGPLLTVPVFFLIGVYGGFIQAGVGLFLLAGLVLVRSLDLVRANALKSLLVLLFTVPATVVFCVAGQVEYGIGLLMALGQAAGAFLGARFATRMDGSERWIRWLLIAILALSCLKLFGVLDRL